MLSGLVGSEMCIRDRHWIGHNGCMRATAPFSEQHLIERFADALWMERGLSDNTLAGYRADLRDLATWLAREGSDLLCASRADLQAYLASVSYTHLTLPTNWTV